jgi:superfamily II DNA/RNA helicase
MNELVSFLNLGVGQELIDRLTACEIHEPTAVQAQAIPLITRNENLLFQSETGTGKTLAYLLPLIEKLRATPNETHAVRLIIAAPTYELASQIKTQVQMVSDCKAALLIGGAPIKRQIELLKDKPEIIIGGPARLLELLHLKKLKTEHVTALVLDEVDRLLAPELRDDTTELINSLSTSVQLVGCSATISKNIRTILSTSGKTIQTLSLPLEDILRKRITHLALYAEQRDKIETLRKLLLAEKPAKALIFTSRIDQVSNIVAKLTYHSITCQGLHAKTDKIARKAAIDRFRSGKSTVLVTSDLAARGLDISGITHVIQMDFPANDDFFIHRAGRTARAGKTGFNIVIGDEWEMRKYAALEKKLGIIVYPKILFEGKLIAPPDDSGSTGQDVPENH